jgi:hypothetical protein
MKSNFNPWENCGDYAKISRRWRFDAVMKKSKINVQTAELIAGKLVLRADESLDNLHPGRQILVDSDQFSFIYLMEGQDDYTYIVLPERIWPLMKKAQDEAMSVWVTNQDGQVELADFQEELEYVISNIKGNSNYGKEMVTKVEEVFS